MNELRKLFINALWLIREEQYWTKGVHARDSKGNIVYPYENSAYCFCSTGAINRASGRGWIGLHDDNSLIVSQLGQGLPMTWNYDETIDGKDVEYRLRVVNFNDSHTYQEVIAHWIAVGIANDYLPAGFTMDQLETLRNSL